MNPIEIIDQQIPLINGSFLKSTGQNVNPIISEATLPNFNKDNSLPPTIIAQDTKAQSFDSSTRKFKGAYSFEENGSIDIGEYEAGVSGKISISPSGIIGINSAGIETLDLDGETGDGTFYGIVKANGFNIADTTGLISTNNFPAARVTSGVNQNTTNTNFEDVSGSSFTVTITDRTSKILFIIFAYMLVGASDFIVNSNFMSLMLYDDFLGGVAVGTLETPGIPATYVDWNSGTGLINSVTKKVIGNAVEMSAILDVAPGTHNYKLQMKVSGGTGTLDAFIVNIVSLGN